MRLADQSVDRVARRFAHAQRGQVEPRRILVQQAQHDALARAGRQCRHAHVDALVAELQRHPAVLRQALLGDVEARHHLEPRHQRGVQRARRLDDVAQHAVDAEAHDRARFVRFEVQVRRALAQRLQQQGVDHPDHRRVGRGAEQILGLRNILQQPREIGVARQVARKLRDRRRLVVRRRELGGEALGVDGQCLQWPLQNPAELGDAFDRCVAARQHENRIAIVLQRQHAVHARERIRNALDVAARGACARRWAGDRVGRHGAARACRSRLLLARGRRRGRRRHRRRRRGDRRQSRLGLVGPERSAAPAPGAAARRSGNRSDRRSSARPRCWCARPSA